VFEAVVSFEAMEIAEVKIISAIYHCQDIGKAIQEVAGDTPVPHREFMIYPGNEERRLVQCLVKPVSDWVQDIMFKTLESQGAEAAYELYQRNSESSSQ